MKAMLGEQGTEQFVVESRVDGRLIKTQPIHDPFIHNTVGFRMSRWDHLKAIFRPPMTKVEVSVHGTQGAQRAIMTLDPEQLAADTQEILEQRRISRESSPVMGCAVGLQV